MLNHRFWRRAFYPVSGTDLHSCWVAWGFMGIDSPAYMCFWIWRRFMTVFFRAFSVGRWGVRVAFRDRPLYIQSKSFDHKVDTTVSLFSVQVGLCHGYSLSQVLFVGCMDRILKCYCGEESVWFRNPWFSALCRK